MSSRDVGEDDVTRPGDTRLRLLLVHHAAALGPKEDPTQPLSLTGRAWADEAALEAARRGVKPRAVWHSGKLRARQTAEAYWRACHPLASFSAERGLQPGDPPGWIADRLLAENGDLVLVGHMPHVALLLRLLVAGDSHASGPDFPSHSAIALERNRGTWTETWRIVRT
jgi:phosphohistidine phosphatase